MSQHEHLFYFYSTLISTDEDRIEDGDIRQKLPFVDLFMQLPYFLTNLVMLLSLQIKASGEQVRFDSVAYKSLRSELILPDVGLSKDGFQMSKINLTMSLIVVLTRLSQVAETSKYRCILFSMIKVMPSVASIFLWLVKSALLPIKTRRRSSLHSLSSKSLHFIRFFRVLSTSSVKSAMYRAQSAYLKRVVVNGLYCEV